MRIAVVGTGISGLSAAWALAPAHDVVVYESEPRPGGHAHTVDVPDGMGTVAVDTGFIVFNERTYPHLTRLFAALDVPTKPSEMSFAFSCDGRFEYRGSLAGLLGSPRALLSGRRRRLVAEILRFRRRGEDLLEHAGDRDLASVIEDAGFGEAFRDDYLYPMAAAIWSAGPVEVRSHPAATFLRFFRNHGLIDFTNRPRWRTVSGGSREYVDRIALSTPAEFRLATPVIAVRRFPGHVEVVSVDGVAAYDEVVIATHSDQALTILGGDATAEERRVLGDIRYNRNVAMLHGDQSLMPRSRRLWSSWNYMTTEERRHADGPTDRASVTYWMNNLQGLTTTQPLFVSLNPLSEPEPDNVHGAFHYSHPMLDSRAVAARRSSPAIQGVARTWFAGAYLGHGFHEDGAQSGLSVAAALGSPAPWHDEIVPASPVPAVRPLAARPRP